MEERRPMPEEPSETAPWGALLFMLVFLLLLVLAWTSIYLQLWQRW